MKKIVLSLSAIAIMAVAFVSCSSENPKSVAEKFATALSHQDFAVAKTFSSDETKSQLDQMEKMASMFADKATLDKMKAESAKVTVTCQEPKIDGDKATVDYTVSNSPATLTLKLVKKGGKWLADWNPMDIINSQMNQAHMDQNAAADSVKVAPPADAPKAHTK